MSNEHFNKVLNEAMHHAEFLMEKNREFYPFGIAVYPNGEVAVVHAQLDDEMPASDDVIAALVKGMKAQAIDGNYVAVAIVSNVTLRDAQTGDTADAIGVTMESEGSPPVTCYTKYWWDQQQLVIGEVEAEQGVSRMFPGTS